MQWRKTNSLSNRFFIFSIIITFSMALILGLSFSIFSKQSIESQHKAILASMVDKNAGEIENLLDNAMKNALRITNDPKFQSVLRAERPKEIAEAYSIELEIDNELSFIHNYVDHLFGFYIVGANGMQFKSNFSSSIHDDWQESWWYRQIIQSDSPIWFKPHHGSFTVNTIGQPLVTLGLKIIDKSTAEILGVLLTDIEVSAIAEIIYSGMSDTAHFILSSSDDTIIAQSPAKLENSYKLFYSAPIELAGWNLTAYYHPAIVTRSIRMMIAPIALLILLLSGIILIASSRTSKILTNPLERLIRRMDQVRGGDFTVTMPTDEGTTEIIQVASTFNVMVSRVNTLMLDLEEKHEKLRMAEMRTLEAQINPHFLYNTLDSIAWLARKERMADVTTTVLSLSKLLRIGLNRGKSLITVAEEMEHVNSYLVIQKIRFGSDFSYTIEYDELIADNQIPKLLLQPLVENAIIHGVRLSETSEEIEIGGSTTEKIITLTVTNTGTPLDSQAVERVNRLLHNEEENSLGVGLKNVHNRVRLYFGEEYGVTFHAEGPRTIVSVHLPRI